MLLLERADDLLEAALLVVDVIVRGVVLVSGPTDLEVGVRHDLKGFPLHNVHDLMEVHVHPGVPQVLEAARVVNEFRHLVQP